MFLQFVICFSIRCDKSLKVVIRPSIFTFFKNFILLIFFLKFLCSFVTCCNLPEAVQFYITIRPSAGHAIQPYCIVLYVLYCIVCHWQFSSQHIRFVDCCVETRSNGTRKRRTADFYVTGNQSPHQPKTRKCRSNERSGCGEEHGQHVPSYDVSGLWE